MSAGDWGILGRLIENIGSFGLFVFLLWKLLDKWAARFLDAQESQASAMAALANAVKDSSGEQREVLIALRVVANRQEETLDWVKEISRNCVTEACRPQRVAAGSQ